MNIYEKLIKARVELQDMQLKKTGKNQSMTYYELGDFLPAINALCNKHKLFTKLNIVNQGNKELAVLTIRNSEKTEEKEDFVCPTAEASLPKGQAIQNLGAKITYLRRYMLMTAFEIAESDKVDEIKVQMTEQIDEKDLEKIGNTKTLEELTKLFKEFSSKYKVELFKDKFSEQRIKIETDDKDKIIKLEK
jgi:alkyl sulfatase BDS1-like metallo-beta-lactamase superfamily hydrolase